MTTGKRIIFVNGVKRSGKDTIGDILLWSHGAAIHKAAEPLYEAIRETFSLTEGHWSHIYNNHKEEPCKELWGMSPRQAMIWYSEDVIKPKFGQRFFGVQLAERIKQDGCDLAVVTDSGMIEEVIGCMENTEDYEHFLINVIRDGTSREGDSREVIHPDDVDIPLDNHAYIENNGTVEELETLLDEQMKAWEEV